MKSRFSMLVSAAALLGLGAISQAQIERLTLDQMVQVTDDGILGTIVSKEVFRVDHPIDGPELYYTNVVIQGHSMRTGVDKQITVTYPGGWIDREHGVDNSEAPTDLETMVGRKIFAFHKWTDNMGGDVSGNALYASHGGLYTTFVNRRGVTVVQGRGAGYAIENNISMPNLEERVAEILR